MKKYLNTLGAQIRGHLNTENIVIFFYLFQMYSWSKQAIINL